MPRLRPFRMGELFKKASKELGLNALPVPVGVNTEPYQGRPASTYGAWSNGFGSYSGDKWDPSITCIPEALASGNLDLRTHCRVLRIAQMRTGAPIGADYIDPLGNRRFQNAQDRYLERLYV